VCIRLETCREDRRDAKIGPERGFARLQRVMQRFNSVMQAVILCAALVTATVAKTPTTALDSCHDDLDHLRKTASEAAEAADDAKSKRDDLDDCRRDPEMHDLMHDHCRSIAEDYESALNDLEGKMDDVDNSLRSVQDSCDYQFTINRLTSSEAAQRRLEASKRRLCASYHKLLDVGIPPLMSGLLPGLPVTRDGAGQKDSDDP
jgi:chromosome segregation ATPase